MSHLIGDDLLIQGLNKEALMELGIKSKRDVEMLLN